jgi:hypothetical protein
MLPIAASSKHKLIAFHPQIQVVVTTPISRQTTPFSVF